MRSLPVSATLAFVLAACGGSGKKPAVGPSPSASPSPAPSPAAKARDLRAECLEIFAVVGKVGGSAVAPSDTELRKCIDEQLSRAQVQCFRDATSLDDVAFCSPSRKKTEKDFGDMDDRRDIEARAMLSELAMAARLYQVDHGAFAKGDTGLTPGPPRCEDDHSARHQPSPEDFAGPLWTALEFDIAEPYAFSYRYVSDGQSFTITAQGDSDCNDRLATYTIKGSVSSGGQFQRSEIELDAPEE
ncbi:MAG: hypothetical protein IT370_07735 [Deltaproteobacteria bacterium]|nr:hypothetical protein [Deltaproteobacteria bacterium]